MWPLCQSVWDSTSHALVACPVIKTCWKGTSFWLLLKHVGHLSLFDIFLWKKEKLSKPELERFAMRAWATWKERLCLIHKQKVCSGGINVDWREILLNDFQYARLALSPWLETSQCNSPGKWVAPPINKLRLDVDAAYNEGSKLRNWRGGQKP